MKSIDIITMAFKNLFRRKTRTFLTTLGIVIGTVSIVVIISLALAMKKNMQDSIKKMGMNMEVITVYPKFDMRAARNGVEKEPDPISESKIREIENIAGVEDVTPVVDATVVLKSGRYLANVRIEGVEPEFMEKMGYKADKGRLLRKNDKADVIFGSEAIYAFHKKNEKMAMDTRADAGMSDGEKKKAKVDVLKGNIVLSFDQNYGVNKPDHQQLDIKPEEIKAVGILKSGNRESANKIFMPIKTLEKMKEQYDKKADKLKEEDENGTDSKTSENEATITQPKKKKGYESIKVLAQSTEHVKSIQQQIKAMNLEAYSNSEMMKSYEEQMNVIQMIFGGIGGISLLVAAIGITNTMVMAIYERRKEIGVMKVIGASIKDIKKLFLLEAAMIGLLGGILGLAFSFGVSELLNYIGRTKIPGMDAEEAISYIPIWLFSSAMTFTTLIGLISGYLPARRAMKLSALEAIKTE